MGKLFRTLLFWILILSACTPGGLSPDALPTTPATDRLPPIASLAPTIESPALEIIPAATTEVRPLPKLIATISTPHIDLGPDGAVTNVPSNPQECGYQWAYKDLPDLTEAFLQSIQALQPAAQAVASGFGEDCVHADGTATFVPMETDFNVTLPVSDLSDEAALGEWIVKVMQVIENLPPDQIMGPRLGRVSILFESNEERKGTSFYIDQYRALGTGLSYTEIYQALQISQ
jgi:hypothetical protein